MDHVRLTLVPVTWAMESTWLFAAIALVSVVTGLQHVALSPLAVGGIVGAAWATVWLLDRIDIDLVKAQVAGAAAGVVVVTAVAQLSSGVALAPWNPFWFAAELGRADMPMGYAAQTLVSTLGGLALWWRGVGLAQRDPGFEPMLRAFRLGLAVVAAEAIFEAFLPTRVGAAWDVVPFFTLGLLALALSHLDEVGQARGVRSERWLWLPPTVIVVMALLTIGVVLGIYTTLWNLVVAAIARVDQVLELLFFSVLLLLGLLAELLVTFLRWFVSLVGGDPANPQLSDLSRLLEDLRRTQTADEAMMALMADLFKYTVIGFISIIVVLLLMRALVRRGDRESRPAVDRDSLWTGRTFRDDMQSLLANMKGLFRRQQPAWAGLGDDPRGQVLRAYLQSLDRAERRGVPRYPEQTPAEYIPRMGAAFPGADGSPQRLTALFEAARFSTDALSADDGRTALQLAEALNRTTPPVIAKEGDGSGPDGPEQEVAPTDLLGPAMRGERMGG